MQQALELILRSPGLEIWRQPYHGLKLLQRLSIPALPEAQQICECGLCVKVGRIHLERVPETSFGPLVVPLQHQGMCQPIMTPGVIGFQADGSAVKVGADAEIRFLAPAKVMPHGGGWVCRKMLVYLGQDGIERFLQPAKPEVVELPIGIR